MDTGIVSEHSLQSNSLNPGHQSEKGGQLQSMREHVISLFPDMTDEIKTMGKDDLLQILEASKQTQLLNNAALMRSDVLEVKNEVESLSCRDKMIEEIVAKLPDMKNDLMELQEEDIKQVYDQLSKTIQPVKQSQKEIKQVEIAYKPPGINNNTLSISQMRERLIQSLQEYRQQFQNLEDAQIVAMYESLEEQERKRKKKSIEEESLSFRSSKRQKSETSQTYSKQKQPKSKKQAKLLKQKHKCKVTFYFDPEDFEINVHSQESRKMGIAKICQALEKAFAKK